MIFLLITPGCTNESTTFCTMYCAAVPLQRAAPIQIPISYFRLMFDASSRQPHNLITAGDIVTHQATSSTSHVYAKNEEYSLEKNFSLRKFQLFFHIWANLTELLMITITTHCNNQKFLLNWMGFIGCSCADNFQPMATYLQIAVI